jgi:hypothetical protein
MRRRTCWKRRSERKRLSAILPCVRTDSIRLGSLLGLMLEGSGPQGDTRHLPLLLEVLQQPHVVVNGLA